MKLALLAAFQKRFGRLRIHRVGTELAWVLFGNAIAVVGGIAGVRFLTEFLQPAEYGQLALGLTVANLINQTVLGPLGSGILRFYAPAVQRGDLTGYLRATGRLVGTATTYVVVITPIAMVCLALFGGSEWIVMVIAAVFFALVSGYNAILNGIQNAARQRFVVALHQGAEPWMRVLVAIALMAVLGATAETAVIGYALAVVVVIGSQWWFFKTNIAQELQSLSVENQWQKQIWTFTWPIATFGVFTWVQLASDRWALEVFASRQDVGFYAVLFQLGYAPISLASGLMAQFFAPVFFQRAGDASDGQRNESVSNLSWRLIALSLGLTGVAFLLALLFHAEIFYLLAANEYASVSSLLPWVVLAGGVFAAGQIIALNLMSRMKTYTMMAAKIVTAALGIALNFAGAYWFGTTGVVLAGVIASISYFLWMAVLVRREEVEKCR